MSGPFVVLGLGNPGDKYAGNRHNAGAMTVAELARRAGVSLKSHRSGAALAEARLRAGEESIRAIFAVPGSYMNNSGGPTSALLKYFKVPPENLIVVHDDLDLPFGSLKLKRAGGEGGHNGLRDISKALGTQDYVRVRFGVGRPPGRMSAADYVLHDFSSTERKDLDVLIGEAADAVEWILVKGLHAAQLRFHTAR